MLLFSSQSLHRRIQAEGLQEEENYVSGRPGVPLTIPKCPVPDLMLFYFKALLLGRGRRRAVPPRYRISLWNQHEATRQGLG